MIDLHLHTTASDGRATPEELVDRAAGAGVRVMAVTDHDTTAGIAAVQRAAGPAGIRVVTGIEITAVERSRDVHVLAYFIDPSSPSLVAFLERQRESRRDRVRALGERLGSLGMPIDTQAVLDDSAPARGRSIGRPQVARAMIAAGYVSDIAEAFDRWLGAGRPAFVARAGSPVASVISVIHGAGGLASVAHPGRTLMDECIPAWRDAGLDALEAYHTDHDPALVSRYRRVAGDLGLLITGGSDYHADPNRGFLPGAAHLPDDDWTRLEAASTRHAVR